MADDIDSLYGAPERDTASRSDTETDSSLSGLYGGAAPSQPRETPRSPDIGDVDPKAVALDVGKRAVAASTQTLRRAKAVAGATAARAAKIPRPSKRTLVLGAGVLALAVAVALAVKFWPHHALTAVTPKTTTPAVAAPMPATSTHIYVSAPAPVPPKAAVTVVSAPAVQVVPAATKPVSLPAPVVSPVAPAPAPLVAKPKRQTPPARKHVMSAQDRANLDKLNAFFGKQGH